MKCDNNYCEEQVPEDNIDMICAYQLDYLTPNPDYKNCLTCNCCNKCRQECHEGLFEE